MTGPDPGRVLRRALIAWGWGHVLLGRAGTGRALIAAELISGLLIAWLTIGLADTSAYLIPYLAGTAFIVAWGWQAIDAYRRARAQHAAYITAPERSPAAAIGWLSLPLLVWGTGFWLIGAHAATPASALDAFVSAWTTAELGEDWPTHVVREADAAAADLGDGPDRFRDVRVRILTESERRVTAVAEAIHFERRDSRFLWVFAGSELVPVSDERVLTLELAARSVELPGGGDIGAVQWAIIDAEAGRR